MYKLMPLAPLFTLACLGLITMVWQNSTFLKLFTTPWVLYFGLCCTALSALTALFWEKTFPVSYDLFCLGALCVWFVHWREVHRIEAPVFSWYPIFFVLLTVLLNRQVVNKWDLMDDLQLKMIRLIHGSRLFHPLLLTTLVLLSVYFNEYFIFYPMLVSLVLIRCSFGLVLRELKAG